MKERNLSKTEKKLARTLVNGIAEQMLMNGVIEVRGKSYEEVEKLLYDKIRGWGKQRPMLMGTDHLPSLLRSARQFAKREACNDAILYYAVWFEHWINGLLQRRLHTWSTAEVRAMLREVNIRGKLTWLLKLTHGIHIDKKHLRVMETIFCKRNEYVHFKWPLEDVDQLKEEKSILTKLLSAAEGAVDYLRRLERRKFLTPEAKKVLVRFTRRK